MGSSYLNHRRGQRRETEMSEGPCGLELITLIANLCVPCGVHQEDEVGICLFLSAGLPCGLH